MMLYAFWILVLLLQEVMNSLYLMKSIITLFEAEQVLRETIGWHIIGLLHNYRFLYHHTLNYLSVGV